MLDLSEINFKRVLKKLYLSFRGTILNTHRLFPRTLASLPCDYKKILFIRVDRIGDMVLSTPAFAALKARWPSSYLTVLASPVNADVLKNNPHVDEVIIYPSDASFSQRKEILRNIRSRAFNLAVDPYDDYELKAARLAWRSGATIRIGYGVAGRHVFFNGPLLKPRPGIHFVDTSLDLLDRIGCPIIDRQPFIYLDEGEKSWALQWLKKRGLGNSPIVGIHPGGFYETQRWPIEYFAVLLRSLRDRGGMDVIIFGSPQETEALDFIATEAGGFPHIFANRDIRRFLALLDRCRLLVCNNSGPLHCATALGIPTISFMGPTDKARWYPLGEGHIVLRRDDLPCIGCGLGRCRIKTHECMRSIEPAEVLVKMVKFLDR